MRGALARSDIPGEMPEDFVADYAFLCDLCAARGWLLGLHLLDDERMALRVRECRGGDLLAGAKFSIRQSLDEVASVVFDVLRYYGVV